MWCVDPKEGLRVATLLKAGRKPNRKLAFFPLDLLAYNSWIYQSRGYGAGCSYIITGAMPKMASHLYLRHLQTYFGQLALPK